MERSSNPNAKILGSVRQEGGVREGEAGAETSTLVSRPAAPQAGTGLHCGNWQDAICISWENNHPCHEPSRSSSIILAACRRIPGCLLKGTVLGSNLTLYTENFCGFGLGTCIKKKKSPLKIEAAASWGTMGTVMGGWAASGEGVAGNPEEHGFGV